VWGGRQPIDGLLAALDRLHQVVVSSRLAQPVFTGFAGLFATGDDWRRLETTPVLL
jgi:hypothetical protein